MKFPILDGDNHIVDIINLEKFKTRLPDAVLMADAGRASGSVDPRKRLSRWAAGKGRLSLTIILT